jgi:hypothetical protein
MLTVRTSADPPDFLGIDINDDLIRLDANIDNAAMRMALRRSPMRNFASATIRAGKDRSGPGRSHVATTGRDTLGISRASVAGCGAGNDGQPAKIDRRCSFSPVIKSKDFGEWLASCRISIIGAGDVTRRHALIIALFLRVEAEAPCPGWSRHERSPISVETG